MPANSNFGKVLATTVSNYQKEITDNIMEAIPLLKLLKLKGSVMHRGGATIVRSIFDAHTSAVSYSGSDALDVTVNDNLTAAEYNWKHVITQATYAETDISKNAKSPEAQIDLAQAIIKNAQNSIQLAVSEMIFGDGTGNGGKDILGLEAIIDPTPTTGTLGGINRATSAFWRNYTNASVGAQGTNLLPAISTMKRELLKYQVTPQSLFAVCDSTTFGYIMAKAQSVQQINKSSLGDIGFDSLKAEGVDIIYDPNCPSDRLYMFSVDHLKFYIHPDYNFKMGPFIEPASPDVKSAKVRFYGQLTTDHCRSGGVLSGITT